jgi:hypothetical protein
MSTWRLIPLECRADWEAALHGMNCSYWHTWRAHHALLAASGLRAYLFVHEEPGTGGRALCPFVERAWEGSVDIYTASGFTGFAARGDCPGACEAWDDMVRERGYVCGYFALHPEVADPSLHRGLAQTHPLYTIDLSQGAEAALAHASRTVRRSIASWQESGMQYVEDRETIARFVLSNYASFMQRAGARPHGTWAEETLRIMLADPEIVMVAAADEQGICAAHSFAIEGTGAEAHVSLSVREGRQHTTALIAWGIAQLAARGVLWLHLGGGITPGDAVARGKQKYHPAVRMLDVAREIYDASAYDRLCRLAGRDPTEASSFFPAYRATAATAAISPANPADSPGTAPHR